MPSASGCVRPGRVPRCAATSPPAIARVHRPGAWLIRSSTCSFSGVPTASARRHGAPDNHMSGRAMPGTDAALLSAEEMLALYACRALSPIDVLQAVTERIARLNPTYNAFAVLN